MHLVLLQTLGHAKQDLLFELFNMRIVQYTIKDMRKNQYECLDMRLGQKASLGHAIRNKPFF